MILRTSNASTMRMHQTYFRHRKTRYHHQPARRVVDNGRSTDL